MPGTRLDSRVPPQPLGSDPRGGPRGATDPGYRRREEPECGNPWRSCCFWGAILALSEGCAPIPLPHYAAYRPRRVEELLVDSENLRQAGDEWERFWFLDQPSHMTPFRTHGGLGP